MIPILPPDLLDYQIVFRRERKFAPKQDYSTYSVEIGTVYMTEDEAREVSKPLTVAGFTARHDHSGEFGAMTCDVCNPD